MNRPFEPNDDSLPEHLSDFEQHLKQHRPRAPRLDASILEISKTASPASPQSLSEKGSDPLEATQFHEVFVAAGEGQTPFRIGFDPYTSRRVSSASRLVGVIAASWICGAVIGGGGMFFSMSRTTRRVSQAEVKTIHSGAEPGRDEPTNKKESQKPPLFAQELAIAPTQELLPNIDEWLGASDKPLHVLTRFGQQKQLPVRSLVPTSKTPSEPIDFQDINAITKAFTPSPQVTRAELMQQYLESSARKIY